MQTSAKCTVEGTGQDCQDFINSHPECLPDRDVGKDFTAKFEWEACNLEPRTMSIISDASNVKIAAQVNGQMYNEKIGQVKAKLGSAAGANSGSSCQKIRPLTRDYNTCSNDLNKQPEKVFFSINVQGTKPNGKYWYECQDFTFKNIQFNTKGNISPNAPPTDPPTDPPTPAPSKGKGKGRGRREGRNHNGTGRRRTLSYK